MVDDVPLDVNPKTVLLEFLDFRVGVALIGRLVYAVEDA